MKRNTEIIDNVEKYPGAIGHAGLVFAVPERVKILKVDGLLPTDENIAAQRYTYARYLILVTKGAPAETQQKFIDFILSDEAQNILDKKLVKAPRF